MKRKAVTALVVIGMLGTTSVIAGPRCHIPLADWQPREALQEKVQALGWTVTRIKTDDGCYKVYGTNEKGQRIKAKFNPATLDMVKRETDD